MKVAMHQPNFLPYLGFFDKMAKVDLFVLLDNVQFNSRDYQQRNRVRMGDDWVWLTVPVLTRGRSGQTIAEVEIDNTRNWQRKVCKTLQHAYGKSAFFKDYGPDYFEILNRRYIGILDLNIDLLRYTAELLGIDTTVVTSSSFPVEGAKEDRLIALCKKIGAHSYLSGDGGLNYIDPKRWFAEGINLQFQNFEHPVYYQRRGGFLPYMSVVDAIFEIGPEATRRLIGDA